METTGITVIMLGLYGDYRVYIISKLRQAPTVCPRGHRTLRAHGSLVCKQTCPPGIWGSIGVVYGIG